MSRLPAKAKLRLELGQALKSFQQSDSKFRVLRTVHPPATSSEATSTTSPKTLIILDSSFNPPSIAHQTLAESALKKSNSDRFTGPIRLLLLFSTMNADKAPSAASFDQRLAMMTIFAEDILENMKDDSSNYPIVPIDIGVTTAPYYTDKSTAIQSEGSAIYPDHPRHVHLIGFDTLTRFFAAKYYRDKFSPPFSALNPYFDAGHSLRATLRPDDDFGSVDSQKAFLAKLENGEMNQDGAKKEWAKQVELVPPSPKAGVSSTKIRKAAKAGRFNEVQDLCTPGVAEWVRSEKTYEEDDRGAKMA
ncbi:Nucleotidylyl transferase [Polychaeton citri CBS 116435]|uniref:Nucleotidylyl transferase n=1 Tax=Polychaeton citri CBS 116435 TaxID=1314669 RepID=A0A9P4Q7X9_9PEZI|nr:Nucleotidylyl transferase [Polychaeton citri CBS 116435]